MGGKWTMSEYSTHWRTFPYLSRNKNCHAVEQHVHLGLYSCLFIPTPTLPLKMAKISFLKWYNFPRRRKFLWSNFDDQEYSWKMAYVRKICTVFMFLQFYHKIWSQKNVSKCTHTLVLFFSDSINKKTY